MKYYCLLLAVVASISPVTLRAATLYWDNAGTGVNWGTASANWSTDLAGTTQQAFVANDNVIFSSTPATNASAVTISNFTETTFGTVTKSSGAALTLSAAATGQLFTVGGGNIDVSTTGAANSLSLSANVSLSSGSSSQNITKTGAGFLYVLGPWKDGSTVLPRFIANNSGTSGSVGVAPGALSNGTTATTVIEVNGGSFTFRSAGTHYYLGLAGGNATQGRVLPEGGSKTVQLGETSADTYTYAGTLENNGANVLSITKTGTNTQNFSYTGSTGAIFYTGTTTVSGGRLNFNGGSEFTLTTGAVNVNSGGTLGGSGVKGGAVTVATGGFLNPGSESLNAAAAPGTLTLSNTLTTSGTITMDIASLASFDRVVGITTFTLGGGLSINLSGSYVNGNTWDLFDFTERTGNFSTLALTGSYVGSLARTGDIWSGTVGGVGWEFNQANGLLSAVPEPSTWALMGLGGGLLLAHLRRRARRP